MRIAVVATTRNAIRQPYEGGQEAQTATLLRGLRHRGHHVRLYARCGSDPSLADELVIFEELPGVVERMVGNLDLPEPDFLFASIALTSVMMHLAGPGRDVDVVHNQTLHHLPPAISGTLAMPMVTTLHTPPFPWLEVGAHLAPARHEFVTVSDDLARRWDPVTPSEVILNGIALEDFEPGPGGQDLAWIGRLVPEKGPDLAIAAAVAAGRRLNLIGPTPDPGFFRDVVEPLLGPHAVYRGHQTHPEAARWIGSSAALLVTPRWDEPFGLVAAEGAATGTPVVALDRGGLPEVVGAHAGLVVDHRGSDDVVAARMARAITVATGMDRDVVRADIRARFDADLMTSRYESLFERVARVLQVPA